MRYSFSVNDPSLSFHNGLNGITAQSTLKSAAIPNPMIENTAINRNYDQYPDGEEGIQNELRSILREIRVITNKIRAEVTIYP